MPFLLMIFLTMVCLPRVDEWTQPSWIGSVAGSALWTWLGVLVTAGYAFIVSRLICWPIKHDPYLREQTLHRYERWRGLHQILLLTMFGLSVWVFRWGWVVRECWRYEGVLLPGADLVLLLPFLAALVLSWAFFYDADRASHQAVHRVLAIDFTADGARPVTLDNPFGSRLGYISFQLRQKLALVFLPVILLLIQKELDLRLAGLWQELVWLPQVLALVSVLTVFATIPWIIRLVLGLQPLPPGPLRDRLEATARRLKFRYSDFLLWNTRQGMANAMIVGILPWLRYVIFTDRLLEEFTTEEVEAVLGHEMGHVKHHHMLCYFAFLVASMAVLYQVVTMALLPLLDRLMPDANLGTWLLSTGGSPYREALPMMAILFVYIFVVFGYLSRRCERQADVFGCRTVSCGQPDCQGHEPGVELASGGERLCPTGIRIFIQALERVAVLNGINRERSGFLSWWQHGTIAGRVCFLETMLADPAAEPAFQRRVAAVKWGLFAALGAVLVLVLTTT